MPSPLRGALKCAAIAAMTLVLACLAIELTRGEGRIAAIWPVNAVLIVILMRHHRRQWKGLMAAMAAGLLGANILSGDTLVHALMFVLANAVEVAIVAAVMCQSRRRKLISFSGVSRLMIAALAACCASTGIATSVLLITSGSVQPQDAMVWFSADFLGIMLFVPILWSLTDRSRKFVSERPDSRAVLGYGLLCAATFFVFSQSAYPLLFLIPPAIVLLSFSGGVKGAACGLLAVAAISLPFTYGGRGPTVLMTEGMAGKVLLLQLFLVSNSILALAVGAAAADRRRLIRQLQRTARSQKSKSRVQKEMIAKSLLAERMAGVGHWSLDPETNNVFWSPEVYAIHGVTAEDFNPNYDDAVSYFVPADREMVRRHVEMGIRTGKGWEFKATLRRKSDGELRRVRSIADCLIDENGRVVRLFGVFKDITDEERLVDALKASESQYRMMADHSSDIIVRFGFDGRITYASPACRILGVTPEEAIGMRITDFAIPDDREFAGDLLRGLFDGGEPDRNIRREIRVRSRTGAVIWLEGSPQVLRNKAGSPMEVVSTFRDITDRKEREAALAEARVEAEKAGQAKAEFLSNMSHEIRTPLNGMLGFMQLLDRTELAPEQRRFVDRARTAGTMLREIVDNILDFSKIESGRMDLEKEAVSLPDLVTDIIQIVEAARPNPDVAIGHDLPALSLMADPTRLKQILTNLIGNAAKFTRAGEIRVSAVRKGGFVRITVADTGTGIPADKIESVFEGFRQADSSITRKYGGTGLGLSISRSLARRMGGDLTLESEPSAGTKATVILPYEEARAAAPPAAADAGPASPGGLRILAVDDVEMNLELLKYGLESAGHLVVTHSSPRAAIAELEAGRCFDLVLMDIQMPEMDGVTAARKIRDLRGPASGIPIIALSANVLPEQVSDYIAAGMSGHFPKPVDIDRLDAFIRSQAGRAPEAAAPVHAPPAEDRIAVLKRQYKAYLGTVAGEFAGVLESRDRAEALGGVRQLAHSIAGTAGSFGYSDVSQAAFQLEASARELLKEGHDTDALIDKLRQFLIVAERAAA